MPGSWLLMEAMFPVPLSNSSSTPTTAHAGLTCVGRLGAKRSTAISDALTAQAVSSASGKAGSWLEAAGSSVPLRNEQRVESLLGAGPRGTSKLRVTVIGCADILGEIVVSRAMSEDIF